MTLPPGSLQLLGPALCLLTSACTTSFPSTPAMMLRLVFPFPKVPCWLCCWTTAPCFLLPPDSDLLTLPLSNCHHLQEAYHAPPLVLQAPGLLSLSVTSLGFPFSEHFCLRRQYCLFVHVPFHCLPQLDPQLLKMGALTCFSEYPSLLDAYFFFFDAYFFDMSRRSVNACEMNRC